MQNHCDSMPYTNGNGKMLAIASGDRGQLPFLEPCTTRPQHPAEHLASSTQRRRLEILTR